MIADLPLTVLPGDDVTNHVIQSTATTPSKLGRGLRRCDRSPNRILATIAGELIPGSATITPHTRQDLRRYRPSLEDRVVGVVQDRVGSDGVGGDWHRVELYGTTMALLSNLAFEGASKRNRPVLQAGQLVYARVAEMSKSMDPVLSCKNGPLDKGLPRKDWMTNEGCYGHLKGGTCCRLSVGLARELLHPECSVLMALSKSKLAFEIAIGVNGVLWIHSSLPEHTILVQNAIQNSHVLTEAQVRGMVQQLVYTVEKRLQQRRDEESDDMEE